MNEKSLIPTILIAVWTLAFLPAMAENAPGSPLSAQEIVERANQIAYYQGRDGMAIVRMTITDSQGRKRRRRFSILRRDEKPDPDFMGDQSFYVYFKRPADLAKTAFMVWKHVASDDDRWLYLPALDLVKRIAASDKRTSFVGSDFFYEDVSGRGIEEDEHELLKTTDNYFVLKNTPKDPKSVEFSFYEVWIYKKNFIPTKIDYFDNRGEKYREYTALSVKVIDGHPTVLSSEMKDLRRQSSTRMEYLKVKYDVGLPKDIFTERYLRHPPKKYLR